MSNCVFPTTMLNHQRVVAGARCSLLTMHAQCCWPFQVHNHEDIAIWFSGYWSLQRMMKRKSWPAFIYSKYMRVTEQLGYSYSYSCSYLSIHIYICYVILWYTYLDVKLGPTAGQPGTPKVLLRLGWGLSILGFRLFRRLLTAKNGTSMAGLASKNDDYNNNLNMVNSVYICLPEKIEHHALYNNFWLY